MNAKPVDSSYPSSQRVTEILHAWDAHSWERLLPLIYDELRELARRQMANERADHTLQATALVNEAYVRLVGNAHMDWKSRRHFFGAAAESMRRILIEHARRSKRKKRGGELERVTFIVEELGDTSDGEKVLELDDALTQLAAEDERAAEVARLRYYAGLGINEITSILNLSKRTILRDWAFARARLSTLLGVAGTEPTS